MPRFPLPETFLEVERANRYALSADRMLAQLYGPAQMTTPKAVAKPAKSNEMGRRGRSFQAEDVIEDDLDDDLPEDDTWRDALCDILISRWCEEAREIGNRADGSPFDPEAPEVKPYLDRPQQEDADAPWRQELLETLLARRALAHKTDDPPEPPPPSEPPVEDSGPGIRSLSP